MREVDQRGATPEHVARAEAGSVPEAARPRPTLSWLALGATLLIVVLLARTLAAYPLVPLRLSFGPGPATPTLVASQQDSGVPGLNLQNVVMVSESDGWATGGQSAQDSIGAYQQELLHWNGSTWSSVADVPSSSDITALDALPGGYLWVAEASTIYQYLGGSWHSTQAPALDNTDGNYAYISAIDMLSPFEGWAIGNVSNPNGPASFIAHYHDGEWTLEQPTPSASLDISVLRDLSMTPDGSEGWAVGSFYNSQGEVPFALHYVDGAWTEADAGLPGAVTSVATVDAGDAWIVGITSGTGPGYIAHWQHDAWLRVTSPTTNQLHAITMLGHDEGYIAGDGAATLHYIDGVWQREGLVIHGTALNDIAMSAPGEGWAVGRGVMLREHRGVWSVYHLSL